MRAAFALTVRYALRLWIYDICESGGHPLHSKGFAAHHVTIIIVNADLTRKLKTKARELGFDAVGVARAAPLKLAEQAITERVKAGFLRDYGFARKPAAAFTHPESLIPQAKTMVVVAMSYLSSDPEVESKGLRGTIARFARGQDYHTVIRERLEQLGKWLSSRLDGVSYSIYVDTGPIIDRAAAREAGIGSYGKNGLIITREFGSWVVLGEMVTDVGLVPDEPAPLEDCGDCDLCIRACPTRAIVSPFVIDQTRCISHLTQMKGSMPSELRPLMGGTIYGCDICQEVCPKNHNVRPGRFPMEGGLGAQPELIPLLEIGQEDFERLIGPTAIGWIGRARFRRNIATAIEVMRNEERE